MIKVENIKIGKRDFKKTYSDEGYYIKKKGTDEIYSEAVDLPTSNFEYEETDKKIEEETTNEE